MNWETLQALIVEHFGAIIVVGGVAITAIGSLIVAGINARSTTVNKFISEVRAENADKQQQINTMKINHNNEIKEIKDENKKLNLEFRALMKRLHLTQDYVESLRKHINDEKDPPAPPRPKGYYGLDDNNDDN